MGIFGFGGVSHQVEMDNVRSGMNKIGAYKSTTSENCERCRNYVGPSNTGSKYYGGCTVYQIKVFSNHVCGNFSR